MAEGDIHPRVTPSITPDICEAAEFPACLAMSGSAEKLVGAPAFGCSWGHECLTMPVSMNADRQPGIGGLNNVSQIQRGRKTLADT